MGQVEHCEVEQFGNWEITMSFKSDLQGLTLQRSAACILKNRLGSERRIRGWAVELLFSINHLPFIPQVTEIGKDVIGLRVSPLQFR